MESTLPVNISPDGVLQRAVSQVRAEVSRALVTVMSEEKDGRVLARLTQIIHQLDGSLSQIEGQLATKNPTFPNEARRAESEKLNGL